jgi:hypothetical protein
MEETVYRAARGVEKRAGGDALVEGGAEFEDALARGLDGRGEGQGGRFIKKKDDAIELAFAGFSGKGEANGMEEIAAAQVGALLHGVDDLLEASGIESGALEKEKGEPADDFARAIAGEDGVAFDALKDGGGVVFQDEPEQGGERVAV